jgi:hypothetical protein
MDTQIMAVIDDYQIVPVSLVIPEEKIFAVSCLDIFPVFHRLFDGRRRGMFMVIEINLQLIKYLV